MFKGMTGSAHLRQFVKKIEPCKRRRAQIQPKNRRKKLYKFILATRVGAAALQLLRLLGSERGNQRAVAFTAAFTCVLSTYRTKAVPVAVYVPSFPHTTCSICLGAHALRLPPGATAAPHAAGGAVGARPRAPACSIYLLGTPWPRHSGWYARAGTREPELERAHVLFLL